MFFTVQVPQGKDAAAELSRNPFVIEAPEASVLLASITSTFAGPLGFSASLETRQNQFGDGRLIPTMSYSLVEYLTGVDLSQLDVLEIGGGGSTNFWSGKARKVLTLETDPQWAQKLRQQNLSNVEIRDVRADQLSSAIKTLDGKFHAIIVDAGTNRYSAAKAALPLLNKGGFVLLDNSDWYPNTAGLLRGADLIQVDFPDFRSGRWYRCATSLFLHPDFRARPLPGKPLPQPVIGGKNLAQQNDWDRITD